MVRLGLLSLSVFVLVGCGGGDDDADPIDAADTPDSLATFDAPPPDAPVYPFEGPCADFPMQFQLSPVPGEATQTQIVVCSADNEKTCSVATSVEACGVQADFQLIHDTAGPDHIFRILDTATWSVLTHSTGDDTGTEGFEYRGIGEGPPAEFDLSNGVVNWDVDFGFEGDEAYIIAIAPQ